MKGKAATGKAIEPALPARHKPCQASRKTAEKANSSLCQLTQGRKCSGANQLSPRRAKLAMALRSKNTHYHLHEIRTRHWQTLAQQSGVPDAFDHMVALVLLVPDALERVAAELPQSFPQRVFKPIRAGMLAQAEQFISELA